MVLSELGFCNWSVITRSLLEFLTYLQLITVFLAVAHHRFRHAPVTCALHDLSLAIVKYDTAEGSWRESRPFQRQAWLVKGWLELIKLPPTAKCALTKLGSSMPTEKMVATMVPGLRGLRSPPPKEHPFHQRVAP